MHVFRPHDFFLVFDYVMFYIKMLDASVSLRPEYGGQQTCRDADHRDLKVAPNGIKTTIASKLRLQ